MKQITYWFIHTISHNTKFMSRILAVTDYDTMTEHHHRIIQQASEFGEVTAGVLSDAEATKLNGWKPVKTHEERVRDVSVHRLVSNVIPNYTLACLSSDIGSDFDLVVTSARYVDKLENAGKIKWIEERDDSTREIIERVLRRRRDYEQILRPITSVSRDSDIDTAELYQTDADPLNLESYTHKFRAARLIVDHEWHIRYTKERQRIQDDIISYFLDKTQPGEKKAIFMAGAMGAGKSHFLRMLDRFNVFPLSEFVYIDPDEIKTQIPDEYQCVKRGSYLHRESTHIADILMHHCLLNNHSIAVDGTLSDREFFTDLFSRLKRGGYTVIIVHVQCTLQTTLNRCRKRGIETGRIIPENIITKSWKMTRDMGDLIEYADYYFHVDTEGEVPKLSTDYGDFVRLFVSDLPKQSIDSLNSGNWPGVRY